MKAVVAYERVSSEKQDLARQAIQRERAKADYPNHELIVVQDDGVSAYKISIFDRPGGRRLIELVKGGKVEAIYADAQDRLSRGKLLEWASFVDLCERNETAIIIDGRKLDPPARRMRFSGLSVPSRHAENQGRSRIALRARGVSAPRPVFSAEAQSRSAIAARIARAI